MSLQNYFERIGNDPVFYAALKAKDADRKAQAYSTGYELPQPRKTFEQHVIPSGYDKDPAKYQNFRTSWLTLAQRKGNETAVEEVRLYEQAFDSVRLRSGESRTNGRANGILTVQSMDDVIREGLAAKAPNRLLGDLVYQGELVILFGPTGSGKSALSMQLSNAVAIGKEVDPRLSLDGPGGTVLYLDCELSAQQQARRYADGTLSGNIKRLTIDAEAVRTDSTLLHQLLESLDAVTAEYRPSLIVLDNITWFSDNTDEAKAVLPIMKALKSLTTKYGTSVLVLAHTQKKTITVPLSVEHLFGSYMQSVFADSVLGLNKSGKDEGLRYLKQVKPSRMGGEPIYTTENVLVCEIDKSDGMLGYKFLETDSEFEHLPQAEGTGRRLSEADEQAIRDLLASGMTQGQVARQLGVSKSTVNRIARS